jgi:hypothetical protein
MNASMNFQIVFVCKSLMTSAIITFKLFYSQVNNILMISQITIPVKFSQTLIPIAGKLCFARINQFMCFQTIISFKDFITVLKITFKIWNFFMTQSMSF